MAGLKSGTGPFGISTRSPRQRKGVGRGLLRFGADGKDRCGGSEAIQPSPAESPHDLRTSPKSEQAAATLAHVQVLSGGGETPNDVFGFGAGHGGPPLPLGRLLKCPPDAPDRPWLCRPLLTATWSWRRWRWPSQRAPAQHSGLRTKRWRRTLFTRRCAYRFVLLSVIASIRLVVVVCQTAHERSESSARAALEQRPSGAQEAPEPCPRALLERRPSGAREAREQRLSGTRAAGSVPQAAPERGSRGTASERRSSGTMVKRSARS